MNFLAKKSNFALQSFQTPAHNCPSSCPLYSRFPPPLPPIPHPLPPIPHRLSPYPRPPVHPLQVHVCHCTMNMQVWPKLLLRQVLHLLSHQIKRCDYQGTVFLACGCCIPFSTPGWRQSKTLFTIDKRGSKIDRNRAFDCHLSPVGRQMTSENSVSNDFRSTFVDSIDVFDCRLLGVF